MSWSLLPGSPLQLFHAVLSAGEHEAQLDVLAADARLDGLAREPVALRHAERGQITSVELLFRAVLVALHDKSVQSLDHLHHDAFGVVVL